MKKIFWAVTFCLMMMFNATVSAEDDSEARQALRESMLANAADDDRVFHEDLLFFMPSIQSELDFLAVAESNDFKSSGEFNIWMTADNGESTELNIPFYAVQNGKNMKVYYQSEKKWYQFQSPSVAAAVTDMVASPTNAELEEMLNEVKKVTILRDTDTQRTFLVNLDGNKIADDMKKEFEKNPADNITAEVEDMQAKFSKYLDAGFRNADVWYIWTVGKSDGKTKNLAIHLSSLLQETARAALNDNEQVWAEPIKEILESIAYYSEVKSYTTFLDSDAKQKLEIPKNVLKAKFIESIK